MSNYKGARRLIDTFPEAGMLTCSTIRVGSATLCVTRALSHASFRYWRKTKKHALNTIKHSVNNFTKSKICPAG